MSTLDCDVLHQSKEDRSLMCKKNQLAPNPKSVFVTLRCPSCAKKTSAFSHSGTPVYCCGCNLLLARPTGGKIELIERVESREKD